MPAESKSFINLLYVRSPSDMHKLVLNDFHLLPCLTIGEKPS